MRKAIILGLGALLAAWFAWPLLLGSPDERDRILAVLDAVTEALENRDAGDVMEHVAAEYRDAQGLRARDLHRFLIGEFLRHRRIVIERLGPSAIELRPDRTATATFTAIASEGLNLRALRRLGVWDVSVEFREIDGEWKITGHRRRQRH